MMVAMKTAQLTREFRLALARRSLTGLAVGDSFGETFFQPQAEALRRISQRELAPAPWVFTDDTVMGIGIYQVLEHCGGIDQAELARRFAGNYRKEPHRGYGATAHSILSAIADGADWREVSSAAFNGMGSMGNGAAMRVAPVGAYFFDDLDETVRQATLSAQVTHLNAEGIAGAIAVAVAAGLAVRFHLGDYRRRGEDFVRDVADHVPDSDTKAQVLAACQVSPDAGIDVAVSVLGNGSSAIAQHTVPLALWCAAHTLGSYEAALWTVVSALGDRDTTSAIVGGIVALTDDGFPPAWTQAAEDPFASQFLAPARSHGSRIIQAIALPPI
jgi:ADP-ribosylglycohydrolase